MTPRDPSDAEPVVIIPEPGVLLTPPPTASKAVLSGQAFATGWHVTLYGEAIDAALIEAEIEAELASVDDRFSPYRPHTELSCFNAARTGEVVALSDAFEGLLSEAVALADLTGGAFDPTLLEAVETWGFGARLVPSGLPPAPGLEPLRGRQGWRDVVISGNSARKLSDIRLDLCGIAKGFAVDRVRSRLEATPGVASGLIEIGGEVAAFGLHPDSQPWWVELETAPGLPKVLVALCGQAVATSGEGVRAFLHDGRLYSHTLDTATAAPVFSDVISATVIDTTCARADALATALIVMGAQRGLEFARREGIACVLTVRGADRPAFRYSDALHEML